MRKLIAEYKATKKNVQSDIDKLNEFISASEQELKIAKINAEHERTLQLQMDVQNAKEYKSVLNADLSNLKYAIEWMTLGHQPNHTRGIERRAAYEREVPVEPYWIQLNAGKEIVDFLEYESENKPTEKELLLKEMTKSLNKQEREILSMAANHMSIRKIAVLTKIPKSTVSNILKRCKEKIISEGWMIT